LAGPLPFGRPAADVEPHDELKEPIAMQNTGHEQTPGGACTVNDGPNKGKRGTYTVDDEGNLWCEGDWGGTQCTGGRCSTAKATPKIFEYLEGKAVMYEVDGLFDVDGAGTFHVRGKFDAATGNRVNLVAIPIAAAPRRATKEALVTIQAQVAKLLK
jgi:hypothetical protein